MIEFAIVVVLLIALVYGIVSFGLILAGKVTITQATADGARSGAVQSVAATAETTRWIRRPMTWAGWGWARAPRGRRCPA
jgi:Flp pilus assembly protein TadG